MKIKCNYCENYINDTVDQCPYCGAPNSGVKRTADNQPKTIEELKAWYKSKNLPPSEVTRFFIGENYTKPRAFGIYHDEKTGNYVVYKNKDSGARAIRYEGSDEAYAVNELFQRLKQEIIQQKMNNVKKNNVKNNASSNNGRKTNAAPKKPGSLLRTLMKLLFIVALFPIGGMLIIMLIGVMVILHKPKEGYYLYQGNDYYFSAADYDEKQWYAFDDDEQKWSAPMDYDQITEDFEKRSTAKKYYLQENWDSSLSCTDFKDCIYAKDLEIGLYPATGYYCHDGIYYYHLGYWFNDGWYICDPSWKAISFSELPYELQHTSLCGNYFTDAAYNQHMPCPDFSQTIYYKDYYASTEAEKGYYQVDDDIYYHLASDYNDGWYTYNNRDWTAVSQEELPDELIHPSTVEDFYFTPTWDASTQYTDFEDTELYQEDKDNWDDSDDSDNDDDFSWSSSDSWSSSSSDWDSDW